MMQKFRKKPVVIEAMQYNEDNLAEVLAFTGKHPRWDEWFSSYEQYQNHVRNDGFRFKILTLEGTMIAVPGDWIIKGVKGEFYPCKPDIFVATYAPDDTFKGPVDGDTTLQAAAREAGKCSELANEMDRQIKAALSRRFDELSYSELDMNTFMEAAKTIRALEAKLAAAEKALEPFAACCDDIRDDEDGEEWAKFRLLVKDYRRARAAVKA